MAKKDNVLLIAKDTLCDVPVEIEVAEKLLLHFPRLYSLNDADWAWDGKQLSKAKQKTKKSK